MGEGHWRQLRFWTGMIFVMIGGLVQHLMDMTCSLLIRQMIGNFMFSCCQEVQNCKTSGHPILQ